MANRITSNPWLRTLYTTLGLISLGLGLVGIVLPLIPTTGPILLSAYFFAMSNERLHRWLLNHKRFGPGIRDYQAGLGIPLRAKVTAIVMIAITFSISIVFVVDGLVVRLLLVALAVGICAFILSRPTKRASVPAAVNG